LTTLIAKGFLTNAETAQLLQAAEQPFAHVNPTDEELVAAIAIDQISFRFFRE